MGKLIPRLEHGPALRRFRELDEAARRGSNLVDMVAIDDPYSAPNPTGGVVIKHDEIRAAREAVLRDLDAAGVEYSEQDDRQRRILLDAVLGRALDRYFPFIRSDVGHNEVWMYLSLMVFPDLVLRRWPPSTSTGGRNVARRAMETVPVDDDSEEVSLPKDRWIGQGAGRDRNYLRTSWRRWKIFGEFLLQGNPPLGEDELVGLTERSSMARNQVLVRLCAETVLRFDSLDSEVRRDRLGGTLNRTGFARLLGRAVVLETGPRVLDILSPDELSAVVRRAATNVMPAAAEHWDQPSPPGATNSVDGGSTPHALEAQDGPDTDLAAAVSLANDSSALSVVDGFPRQRQDVELARTVVFGDLSGPEAPPGDPDDDGAVTATNDVDDVSDPVVSRRLSGLPE